MTSLNLIASDKTTLPASAFPAFADIYVCDKCGRDITKHFHRGRAHVWRPMGPEKYLCHCGQKYLTGATEWDHLVERERQKRVRDTAGLGLLFSLLSAILGLVVYLGFHRSGGALIAAWVIAAFPFMLMQAPFWLSVAASMWRTRVGSGLTSERT